MIFNINHKINQFLMKRILHLYDRNNLPNRKLCYSISKPISNKEDTLKSFITFDITPYMPIFRMVVGSQIVTPKQILLIITIKIIHLYLQQARDQSKGGTIFFPFFLYRHDKLKLNSPNFVFSSVYQNMEQKCE